MEDAVETNTVIPESDLDVRILMAMIDSFLSEIPTKVVNLSTGGEALKNVLVSHSLISTRPGVAGAWKVKRTILVSNLKDEADPFPGLREIADDWDNDEGWYSLTEPMFAYVVSNWTNCVYVSLPDFPHQPMPFIVCRNGAIAIP
jgi:hypothetical protein